MSEQKPSVGRVVHYVSHGTPPRRDGSQAYTSRCRAAIVTEVCDIAHGMPTEAWECASLVVLNPTGQFFNEHVLQDEDAHAGGTWHWPERV